MGLSNEILIPYRSRKQSVLSLQFILFPVLKNRKQKGKGGGFVYGSGESCLSDLCKDFRA